MSAEGDWIFLRRWSYPGKSAGGDNGWSYGLSLQRCFQWCFSSANNSTVINRQNCIQPVMWHKNRPIRQPDQASVSTAGWTFWDVRAAASEGTSGPRGGNATTGCSNEGRNKSANRQPARNIKGRVCRSAHSQGPDWQDHKWRNPTEPWVWWRDPKYSEVP